MRTRNTSLLKSKENKNISSSKRKVSKVVKNKEIVKDASYRDSHNIGRRKSTASVVTYSLDSRLFFDVYAKFNNENLPKDRNIYNGLYEKSSPIKRKVLKKSPESHITSKKNLQLDKFSETHSNNDGMELSNKSSELLKVSCEAKPCNQDESCIPSPKIPCVSPMKSPAFKTLKKKHKTNHSSEHRVISTRNSKPIEAKPVEKAAVATKPSKNETFQRLLDNKTVFKKHLSQNLKDKKQTNKPASLTSSPIDRRLSKRLNKSTNESNSVIDNIENRSSSPEKSTERPELNKIELDLSMPKRGKRIASLNAAAIINCVQDLFSESGKKSPGKLAKRVRLSRSDDAYSSMAKNHDVNKRETEVVTVKSEETKTNLAEKEGKRKSSPQKNEENKSGRKIEEIKSNVKNKDMNKEDKRKTSPQKDIDKKPVKKLEENRLSLKEKDGKRKTSPVKNEDKKLMGRKIEEKKQVKEEEKVKILANHAIVKRIDVDNDKKIVPKNNVTQFFDITLKSNSKQSVSPIVGAVAATATAKKPQKFEVLPVPKKRKLKESELKPLKKAKKPEEEKRQLLLKAEEEEFDNGESLWQWEGEPSQKVIQLQLTGEPVERTCYNAIRHSRDDVVVRTMDCVMLRSSADQEPFLAKISVFYLDEVSGKKMMTLLWYYRPEHTEQGRLPWHTDVDVYASRHLDNNSVDCIEDKAFVLPIELYSRFMAYQKRQSAGTRPGLAARLIPAINEDSTNSEIDDTKPMTTFSDTSIDMFVSSLYYTINYQNSFPVEMTNSNVFVCRGLYDINQHKITRNILQNIQSPKLELLEPCESVNSAMSISSCDTEPKEETTLVLAPAPVPVPALALTPSPLPVIETPLSEIPIPPPINVEPPRNSFLPPISSFQIRLPNFQTETTVPVEKSCPPPPPSKPIQPPLPPSTNGDLTADCPNQPNGHP